MRVAIVENTPVTHHGQVGVALNEAAALIDIYRPREDGRLPEPGMHDALVVFGGEQSAMDDADHPYLPALAGLMRATSDAGRSVLGICLGSQILARAFGAENRLGAAPEFGWVEVRLTDHGQADPVLSAAGAAFPIFQWHSDTFTAPPGSLHLAVSDGATQQAFRLGRATYGMQFHFEANRAQVADWNRRFPDLVERVRPGWLAESPALSETLGAGADRAGIAIARAWVSTI